MKGIMIQGTSSDVGKSMICTAFGRILADEGKKVAPFKSQNMSNNSYVTVLGEEIGRAQGVQAEAAGIIATVDMNPILLKPESSMKSQVVLFGKKTMVMDGMDYRLRFYGQGKAAIAQALANLEKTFTHIVIEGAGSPAEVNLNDRDLVNMAVAEYADVPVILVADIERGGVFASIIGTLALVPNPERVKGLLINKFRGDIRLFEDGIQFLEEYTGLPVLGVIPYLPDHRIEQEDSLGVRELMRQTRENTVDIAVLKHPYLSNFTDLEPLFMEQDTALRWIEKVEEIGQPDILVIPGTKSTISDLRHWKQQGLAEKLQSLQHECWIVGLCGGYQMMGEVLRDPTGFDGPDVDVEDGLGLIAGMETVFMEEKLVARRSGKVRFSDQEAAVEGYEIHTGRTTEASSPLIHFKDGTEGYFSGKILGTHLHGFFANAECRNAFLAPIRRDRNLPTPEATVEVDRYGQWAEHVKAHIDWPAVRHMIEVFK